MIFNANFFQPSDFVQGLYDCRTITYYQANMDDSIKEGSIAERTNKSGHKEWWRLKEGFLHHPSAELSRNVCTTTTDAVRLSI